MTEQNDPTIRHVKIPTCGICSEPFKDGDVAVEAARCSENRFTWPPGIAPTAHIGEKFWAHPVCLFSIAREAEGPASRVAAIPPEPPDDGGEALPEKRTPK